MRDLTLLANLKIEILRTQTRAARLKQAILAKDFSEQLVPQDPNEEPASILLDKIRSERATAERPKRALRAKAAVQSK